MVTGDEANIDDTLDRQGTFDEEEFANVDDLLDSDEELF